MDTQQSVGREGNNFFTTQITVGIHFIFHIKRSLYEK